MCFNHNKILALGPLTSALCWCAYVYIERSHVMSSCIIQFVDASSDLESYNSSLSSLLVITNNEYLMPTEEKTTIT